MLGAQWRQRTKHFFVVFWCRCSPERNFEMHQVWGQTYSAISTWVHIFRRVSRCLCPSVQFAAGASGGELGPSEQACGSVADAGDDSRLQHHKRGAGSAGSQRRRRLRQLRLRLQGERVIVLSSCSIDTG